QAAALGAGEEGVRRQQLAAGAAYPKQQLVLRDAARPELDDRLAVEDEAVPRERLPYALRPAQAPVLARQLGAGLVGGSPVAPPVLGRVHRHVGLDQQLLGAL